MSFTIKLTEQELEVVLDALDSHEYWQLSEEFFRNEGYVHGSGAKDPEKQRAIAEVRQLFNRIGPLVGRRTL